MRVAVFRAVDDGRRTAARLAALGHEPILAPVIRIVPTGATVPPGGADALVFTSAHAPAALAAHRDGADHLRGLPCWCVGARTAAAARVAGFSRISIGPGDAARLAAILAAAAPTGRVTLVAGRDRKPELERSFARRGLALGVVEAYSAEACPDWPGETIDALGAATAALHYSRRSAVLAHRRAAAAGMADQFHNLAHACLSEDVATALRGHGIANVSVAARPEENSLLALLPP